MKFSTSVLFGYTELTKILKNTRIQSVKQFYSRSLNTNLSSGSVEDLNNAARIELFSLLNFKNVVKIVNS